MSGQDLAIEERAAFDDIRYAQVWEDADVLVDALRVKPHEVVVSIASAGDNALALLGAGARTVIAVDLSPAQLACVRVRVAAYQSLSHGEFLALMGSRPSPDRADLLARVAAGLSQEDQAFWRARQGDVVAHGLGGIGKFERYFRLFRTRVLPLVHGRGAVNALLSPKSIADRRAFYDTRWNSWRWRALIGVFFSKFVMGRLGRDPAFFDHAPGGLSAQVARLTRGALVDQDPSTNPYLHWILKGSHGATLPLALREESFVRIRDRLMADPDCFVLRAESIDVLAAEGVRADAFNLSDIFEYMGPQTHLRVYQAIINAANQGARLAYWNMMAPRAAPAELARQIGRDRALEAALRPQDKAFFYRDFVIETVQ